MSCTGAWAYAGLGHWNQAHKPETPLCALLAMAMPPIGANHLIQAARRNLDVTVILVNNFNFAMTGGKWLRPRRSMPLQLPHPYGSSEPPFDICELAVAAGSYLC